jgi:hypothetical protein
MKKLQGLTEFNKLTNAEMSQVLGGILQATGAGTLCVNPAMSASGCMSYSSDTLDSQGGGSYTPANGTACNSDVNQSC